MAIIMNRAVLILVVIFSILQSAFGLYEDQVGKFDWRQQYVGHVSQILFESGISKKHAFVSSDSNVLASINLRNGQLGWRQLFQKGQLGKIDAMLYTGQDLVTISGGGHFIRSWDPSNGLLQWETLTTDVVEERGNPAVLLLNEVESSKQTLLAVLDSKSIYIHNGQNGAQIWTEDLPDSDKVQYKWLHLGSDGSGSIYAVGVLPKTGLKVVSFKLEDGEILSQITIPAPWATIDSVSCTFFSSDRIVCADSASNVLRTAYLDQKLESRKGVTSTSLLKLKITAPENIDLAVQSLYPSHSRSGALDSFILRLNKNTYAWLKVQGSEIRLVHLLPPVDALSAVDWKEQETVVTVSTEGQVAQVRAYSLEEELTDQQLQIKLPSNTGKPSLFAVALRERYQPRILLQTSDEALHFVASGSILWTREEALASAVTVEMMDLPVSDTEAKFEDEFGTKKGDNIFSMFARRISTQLAQLKSNLEHLKRKIESFQRDHAHHHQEQLAYAQPYEEEEEDYLTRDDFNLHKLIIVVTSAGKVFGLDSTEGAIIWSHFIPNIEAFDRTGSLVMPLLIQRTTAHFPHPPQCTLIGREKGTGNTLLISFNPITGQPITGQPESGVVLPLKLKQVTMQNLVDEEFLKVILLMDKENKVYLYPPSAKSVIEEHKEWFFFFTAEPDSGSINGYQLSNSQSPSPIESLPVVYSANEVWNVQFPPLLQRITRVLGRNMIEEVHSQGRVLGDRSVLYKYLNPNMVVVMTEGEDATAKSHISIYLIDVVTGSIIFQTDHKRVNGPVHVVLSENWVVYHFWNNRYRRNEVTVLELYEGKSQKNSTTFSSLDPPTAPLVERQSYIFPEAIQAMTETKTEKGITSKNVLFVLQSGGILALPKRILDPRRTLLLTQSQKEEGLIPYIPEIKSLTLNYINYNQSVFGVTGIHTSPAGLESTCLVLTYGLDYYFTRTSPSNLFDVLKEDFDYLFICTVLIGLLVAAIITKRLAAKKALRQNWR